MISARLLTPLAALACLVAVTAIADERDDLARQNIVARFPEVKPANIKLTGVPGLYEIRLGAQVSYVSEDGRFLLQGELYDAESEENLTERRLTQVRLEALDEIGESSMIIFAPEKYDHTITVFTDIDCGYCRKLHRAINEYNDRGIRVRYIFFPRSGPQTESWFKAESVWCAADRNAALTQAKSGLKVESEDCGTTPVAETYKLGRTFGIQGTPAIVADTGELIGGYVSPQELQKYLGGGN